MLGPLEVQAGGALLDLGGEWPRRLLARLLVDANQFVASDQLVADLLGKQPSPSALAALMNSLSRLRKALGPAAIATGPDGYKVRLEWKRTDIYRFAQLAAAGRERLAAGEAVEAAEMLRLALDLWRGEPLGDFGGEAWARQKVATLDELRLGTIEDQIDARLATRNPAVLPMIERLVVHYPRRGRLRGQLMLALDNAGRQAEALAAFNEAQRFLTDEHGRSTGPLANELRALRAYLSPPGPLSVGVSSVADAGEDTERGIALGITGSSPTTLADSQPRVQPTDAAGRLFDDWAFRLGHGEWPDPNTYLELAGDDTDELLLLMDTYIRALPRLAPAHEDIERAQTWLASAPAAER
jgi:DNA-binding SARP family transcriptional activator